MADTWECAYAAGLFDGEGCVQIYMRTRGTYRDPEGPRVLPVDEVSTRRDLVARLKELKKQEYKIG